MSDAGSRALDEQPKQPESSYVVSPVPTKMAPPARAKREPVLTPWFAPTAKPARVGWYQIQDWLTDERAMDDDLQMAWWGGRKWFFFRGSVFPMRDGLPSPWRGLATAKRP